MTDRIATILFTDLEGSTALYSAKGHSEAQTLLAAVDSLGREQVRAHGGRTVKSLGDGLLAVFTSPCKAVACALAIQVAVADHGDRHPGQRVRVRAGLHTGEVSAVGGDLAGEAVAAAARICSRARGGEVLGSEVVKHLCGSLTGISFENRGRVALKGFPERWRLFRVLPVDDPDGLAAVSPGPTPLTDRMPSTTVGIGALRFGILGPLQVSEGERLLPFPPRGRRAAVLTALLVHRNQVVSMQQLIDWLWGEEPIETSVATLHTHVFRLRAALQGYNREPALLTRGSGYELRVPAEALDSARFERLVAAARAQLPSEPGAAATTFREALSLWRGPALAGFEDEAFARAERVRLEELRLAAVEDRIEAELLMGQHAGVVGELQSLVTEHPTRERLTAQLMRALYGAGRQADSLQAYGRLREHLAGELGIDPSPELRGLERAVLRQELEEASDRSVPALEEIVPAGRHNLPVILSRFVGREKERRRVAELLEASRLLTLTGAGGVGKTRLALEVARALLLLFPDGVLLAELAPLSDPTLMAPQLAAQLDLLPARGQSAPAALVDHLSRRRMLLVFDNCEHLLAAVGTLVDTLVRGCPLLTIMATSRERLGVAGETVWRVPSLSHDDAVALFCDRALSLDADFRLGPEAAADVGHICRRLDGIPLAIELATARLGVLSAGEIAAQLDERFRFLTRAPAGAPSRHQTLHACMEWGHELLAQPEQVLLRRLGVFAGSFELEAAEAVAQEAGTLSGVEVLDLLARLVDTSWVFVELTSQGTRFRLTETVRQYAVRQLAACEEEERLRRRHRDHFLVVASSYLGPPLSVSRGWLTWVGADYENLQSALEWSLRGGDHEASLRLAGRLFPYWALDGRYLEGRVWLERALSADPDPSGAARVWALVGLGLLILQLGDYEAAAALWREARDLAVPADDTVGKACANGYLGCVAIHERAPDAAEELFADARRTLDAAGCAAGVGWCDFNIGWAILGRGDRRGAAVAFDRALLIGRQQTSDVLVAHAQSALATLSALEGDGHRALELAVEAVGAARRLGLRNVLVMALSRAAEASVLTGDSSRTVSILRESLGLIRDLGGRMWLSDSLQLAAVALASRGRAEVAVRLLAAATGDAGVPTSQGDHRPLQQTVETCRGHLSETVDPVVFDAEWRVGRTLSFEDGIDQALSALQDP